MIDPDAVARLMADADYMPGAPPPAGLLRFAEMLVERCASIADAHDPEDEDGAGVAIRAGFGLA